MNAAALNPRTRALLEAPLVPLLLRLGAPNVGVMLAQAGVGLVETWLVGKLGTDALAGMALVFPLVMLMQMMSAGAFGGAIASAVARALGARRQADADALVAHALAVAAGFGLLFTLGLLLAGPALYAAMGGSGDALRAALTYSNWVFAGALLVWLFNALAALIRGTGNMAFPAWVICIGALLAVPLSALLIFGAGPVPGLGIAGGALALLLYYGAGCVAFGLHLVSRQSLLRPAWRGLRWQRALFADILRVGLAGALSTVMTNLTIAVATALAGGFGAAAIAGYGTAARLEYLLVPLVFGLGAPLVAIVGTCIGAGLRARALRAAWTGAALAFAITTAIGLLAAAFPHAWLGLFGTVPAMLAAGSAYLRVVGPVYGFFGLGLVLYFASQGAGRLKWPVIANVVRLAVAAIGGVVALRLGAGLAGVFAAQAAALVLYGLVNAGTLAAGAWFGPLQRPWRRAAPVPRPAPLR